MNDIFKNAYFGKAYKARNGKKAIYLGYTNNSIYHICFIEDESNKTLYFNNGDAWGHQRKGNNVDDIVSEWQEEINEKKLDELAEEYFLNTYNNGVKDPNLDIINEKKFAIADFKAGYRKAKEE